MKRDCGYIGASVTHQAGRLVWLYCSVMASISCWPNCTVGSVAYTLPLKRVYCIW